MWYQRIGDQYINTDTLETVTDAKELARIRKLRIPSGYHDVLINQKKSAKVQAFGFDSKNRKQMIYHPKYVEKQAAKKFKKFMSLFHTVPKVLAAVEKILDQKTNREHKDDKELAVAVVVALMFYCGFRVGNDKYVRQNNSFGLTTLQCRHVKRHRTYVQIRFRGKKGVENVSECHHERIVKYLKARCKSMQPSDRLFSYMDAEGKRHAIVSKDVNDYLKTFAPDMTSKDVRTWNANKLFMEFVKLPNVAAAKDPARRALHLVAAHLHHTPAVCRSSYIHPHIYAQHALQ
jgi:DNA topoisomerase I